MSCGEEYKNFIPASKYWCVICGNECDTTKAGICCIERLKYKELYDSKIELCNKCKNHKKLNGS